MRFRPGNHQVVHRAVDAECPDVPAGKENRIDNIAVRCESDLFWQVCRIQEFIQEWVRKILDDVFVDEISHHLAAAAQF